MSTRPSEDSARPGPSSLEAGCRGLKSSGAGGPRTTPNEDRTALLEELQQAYLYRDRMSYAPKLDTPDMWEQKLAARARNERIIRRLERQLA